MKFFKNSGFVVFGIFAIADLILMSAELFHYRYATKPFLLPLLLITILANASGQSHPVSKPLLVAALFAGTLGDIFLIDDAGNKNFFIYGLVCFLLMQLLFFVYFFRMQAFKAKFMISNLLIAGLLLVYCCLLVSFLWHALSNLKGPVIVYAAAIAAMFLAAANIYHSKRAHKLAVNYFIPGAGLLVLSDSLLAYNKFIFHESFFDIAVMVTYLLGQLLLSVGFIKHLKSGRHGSGSKKDLHTGEESLMLGDTA
jgi:uncharacterized membrane protein YhhN